MSYLKFRFWCPAGKAFIRKYRYSGPVDKLFSEGHKFDVLIPQQCLGIKDRRRRWIYEGDILELAATQLPPSLGMLATAEKLGPNILAEVSRDPSLPSNFHLEVRRPKGKHLTLYLPLELAKKAKICGHIFAPPAHEVL
jgi:hypothetical protein